jgi:hypothetical protein
MRREWREKVVRQQKPMLSGQFGRAKQIKKPNCALLMRANPTQLNQVAPEMEQKKRKKKRGAVVTLN